MILYTILAILYIVTCVGYYKILSKETLVQEAFDMNPKLAMMSLIVCSLLWPVVCAINYTVAAIQR